MTGAAIAQQLDIAKEQTAPPIFPPRDPEVQEVLNCLEGFRSPADRKMVPGLARPIELIEVESLAQLPVILKALQESTDTVRLVFPAMKTGDSAKDARIEDEQRQIHHLLKDRHSQPLGQLISEAMSKVESSYVFDAVRGDGARMDIVRNFWMNNNIWNLNETSSVKLGVQEVIDVSAGANDVEKAGLCDMFVSGVAASATQDRFLCMLPADAARARDLGQRVLEAVDRIAATTPVNLDTAKVLISPAVVWEWDSVPANPPCAVLMSLAELKKRIENDEELVPSSAPPIAPGGSGRLRKLIDKLFYKYVPA